LTSEQREKSFNEMIYYSLEIAISLWKNNMNNFINIY
jgi:hypothetical protein